MEPGELLAQGMEFDRAGDRKQARELIAKAVKADPSLKQGWWALAHLLDDQDRQIDCLKQALKLDPSNEQARAKLEQLTGAAPPGVAQEQAPLPSESQVPPDRLQPTPVQEVPSQKPVQHEGPAQKVSRSRRRYIYVAGTVVAVILVGALVTWLIACGTRQDLLGGGQDELVNLSVPTMPAVWTPTMDLAILVPTFSPAPSVTQQGNLLAPTEKTQRTPTRTPTPRFTPTITPTYDPRLVPTSTRATAAECPITASPGPLILTDPFEDFYAAPDEVLAYLNAGGSVTEVRRALGELQAKTELVVSDLTHDGIDEIVLFILPVYVFGCRDGQYVELLEVQPEISDPYFAGVEIFAQDFNLNGIPDLLFSSAYWGARNYTLNVQVYEWNGADFITLIPEVVNHPYDAMGNIMFTPGIQVSMYNGYMDLEDVDDNGTIEIILRGGNVMGYIAQLSAPQTSEIHTWMWNGEEFNFYDVAFSSPTLKIHAVQAGDVASQLQKFEQALELYWQAIEDPSLEAWNVERNEWMPEWTDPGTPTPTHPPPDPDQGDRVEAYARFRIVVTNLLLGRYEEAEAQYQKLLDLHPVGNPGDPFAQMASAFWEAYQASTQVADGCAAARAFADQNQGEILGSLGWAVYGEANMTYDAEDICPFQ